MTGRDAQTTAAADALRRGQPALTRSFRFHRPRGAPCGGGWCGLCEIDTPSGRELACTVAAAARLRRDPLRPLGFVAERFPPWFYERRLLRPRRLRRAYLHTLRHLSSAPRLDHSARATGRAFLEETLDVAIVGHGGNVDGVALGVYADKTLAVLRADAVVALAFDRLVIDLPAYDRLPPISGNDLPGVVGLGAFAAYAAQGGVVRGARVAAWGARPQLDRVAEIADAVGATLTHADSVAPEAVLGRGAVGGVRVGGRRIACDLFVAAVRQPPVELALQAGARAELTHDGLPILALADAPDWLELRGETALRHSDVPDVAADDGAFACLCEDVRVRDVRSAVASGFTHPELVKRRTGAMTGPCQGKLCAPTVLTLLREAGAPHSATTSRPPAVATRLADLAADA